MNNVFITYETYTNGFLLEILDLISIIAILSGIFVIISNNPIISVLFLIGLFLSISGYLILLGINFIGLSYLLVYVGAVSILFLFILMLINVRISELFNDANNSIPLAIIITIAFNYPIYEILPNGITSFNDYIFDLSDSLNEILNKDKALFNNKSYINSINMYDDEILFVTSKV
jgi:NADH-ubiquinone oxidoreductase chain 6